ncbi:hypothetical protein C8Q80DRAFT_1269600 [Daedaleopsis nitida]|nr:hypothetical protein C8Q80DRAFT_1269600 [Daedaleopsis nitida]
MSVYASPRCGKSCAQPVKPADVYAGGTTSKTSWREEVQGRVHWFPGPFEDFLDDLVPCSVPCTLNDDISNAFDGYRPGKGKEIPSYPGLNAGLNALVKSFGDRKFVFYDTHGSSMSFPFETFAEQHAISYPDLCASWPGETIPKEAFEKKNKKNKKGEEKTDDEINLAWQQVALIGEVKAELKDNPFPRRGKVHADTVVKLARCARNLLLANGLLATFVLGIYETMLHVVRFDHSSAIVSPAIDFKEDPRLLQRFLWHLTHPVVGDSIVGCDPTVRRLTSVDREWVARSLKDAGVENVEAELKEFYNGRRMEVPHGTNGASTPYICYRLLDVNARLFSRATTVWLTLEDTRLSGPDGTLVDQVPPPSTRIRIMKEAWRQLVRKPESAFYDRLAARIPDSERRGLAKLVCGGDLGELEVQRWEKTSPKASKYMQGQRDLRLCSDTGEVPLGTPCNLPYPQHQTFSWAVGLDPEWTYRERSHMRFVIDVVGRPITRARNTKQVVTALRDAIIGHRLAWEKAGVLHRDVSLGNILIVDEEGGEHSFEGFLHDFDYSAMTPDAASEMPVDDLPLPDDPVESNGDGMETIDVGAAPPDDQRKERTGTYHFMAIEILLGRVVHCVHHDLESFYWVLLWILVRHTEHNFSIKEAQAVFEFGNERVGIKAKKYWLDTDLDRFNIPKNSPLMKLLVDFSDLVLKGTPNKFAKPVPLTYDAVLSLFDTALAAPGWPDDDIKACTWFGGPGRSVVQGMMSDNLDNKPIAAPSKTGSRSEIKPPPDNTETRAVRSKRRSEVVERGPSQTEAGSSSQTTGNSFKRRRTAGSRAGSSGTVARSGSNVRSTGHAGSRSGLRSQTPRSQQS